MYNLKINVMKGQSLKKTRLVRMTKSEHSNL